MKPYRGTKALQNLASLKVSPSPKPLPINENFVDARIIKTGFDPNTCRSNFLVEHFLKRGEFSKARQLFEEMPNKNTVSTNMMISGYVKSGNLKEARELFDRTVERTVVSWTILIGGYSQRNQFNEAFKLYAEMLRWGTEPDYVTFATLLSGCNDTETAKNVIQVHADVVKLGFDSTLIVCNSLIDSYCKCHSLDLAFRVFKEMPGRDSVSFNAMITGYSKDGLNEEAVNLFVEMQHLGLKPSEFTFAAVLCAGVGVEDMALGKQVHCFVIKTNFVWNVFVGNALLDFYSKHDSVVNARKLFDEMPELDGISYNVIISGYAWDGQYKESLELFRKLQQTGYDRKQFPFSTILSIAANRLDLELGRQIHSQTVLTTADLEIVVGNALVDMYAKCGRFEEAETIFASLAFRSTVPWTAMISGYVQKGLHEEGLLLFREMRRVDVKGDQATFATILRATANLASLPLGKQLHSFIIRSGNMSNVFAGSALLDMYAKCGSIKDAIQTFEDMPDRNLVSWNALISAYAQNGDGEATVKSFEDMVLSGLRPDSVSFLCVLSACSHCGLVEKGLQYFQTMTQVYKLDPKREHYSSMVDVLCRSGRFDEAEKLIAQMPFDPDEIMWTLVLNSCRIHKNQELAIKAADKLFNMELRDAAAYINLSNIYAFAGQWDSVGKVKKAMRDRGIQKVPAYSWIEMNHNTHKFSANDKLHPQMDEIMRMIEILATLMEEEEEEEGSNLETSCMYMRNRSETSRIIIAHPRIAIAVSKKVANTGKV